MFLCQGTAIKNVCWSLLLVQAIVSADVGTCPGCKLPYRFSCRYFRTTSVIFHKCLEILTTSLRLDWLTTMMQLCMGPAVATPLLICQLSTIFTGEENRHTKLSTQVLKCCLLPSKVNTFCEYTSEQGVCVNNNTCHECFWLSLV
jgi:hypothetical protein